MTNEHTRLHRRSLLKGVAVGGVGMLAGCARGPLDPESDDTDGTSTTTETTTTTDKTATTIDNTDETTTTTDKEGTETVVVRISALDQYTGGPAHDVTVTGKRHEPGPDGKPVTFEVEIDGEDAKIEIPVGTYDVTFSGEAYSDVTDEFEVSADEDHQIIGVELPLDISNHEVTVKVVDANGDPIDEGKVELGYPPEVFYTESDGDEYKQVVPIENGTATMMLPEAPSTDPTSLTIRVDGCEPVGKSVYPEEDMTVTVQLGCER